MLLHDTMGYLQKFQVKHLFLELWLGCDPESWTTFYVVPRPIGVCMYVCLCLLPFLLSDLPEHSMHGLNRTSSWIMLAYCAFHRLYPSSLTLGHLLHRSQRFSWVKSQEFMRNLETESKAMRSWLHFSPRRMFLQKFHRLQMQKCQPGKKIFMRLQKVT